MYQAEAKYHRQHVRCFDTYIFFESVQILKSDIANAQGNNSINQEIIDLYCIKGCKDKGNTVPDSECGNVFNNIFEFSKKKGADPDNAN